MNIALALLFILQLHSIQLQPHDGIDILLNGNSNSNQNNAQTRNDEKSMIHEENESKPRKTVILTPEDKSNLNIILQIVQKAISELHELTSKNVTKETSKRELKNAMVQMNRIHSSLTNAGNVLNGYKEIYDFWEPRDEKKRKVGKDLYIYEQTKKYNTSLFKETLLRVKDRIKNFDFVKQYLKMFISKKIKVITIMELLEKAEQHLKKVETNSGNLENVENHLNEAIERLNNIEIKLINLENVEKHLNELNLTMTKFCTFIEEQPQSVYKFTPIVGKANKTLNDAKFQINVAIDQMNVTMANSNGIYTMNENLGMVMKQLNDAMAQMIGGTFAF